MRGPRIGIQWFGEISEYFRCLYPQDLLQARHRRRSGIAACSLAEVMHRSLQSKSLDLISVGPKAFLVAQKARDNWGQILLLPARRAVILWQLLLQVDVSCSKHEALLSDNSADTIADGPAPRSTSQCTCCHYAADIVTSRYRHNRLR